MSSEKADHIEQDQDSLDSADDLPTYDDLAAQNGPNSRFGRWRGWIEKRAAERYNDINPDELRRRRERGWGNEELDGIGNEASAPTSMLYNLASHGVPDLQIQTAQLTINTTPSSSSIPRIHSEPPLPPLPFVSQRLPPTHLKINHFGSRFLPHAASPIRCILPLLADRLLLIGHEEGLSVLDMFPQELTSEGGISIKGPDEAQARAIWRGEGVYQMSILEKEDIGEDSAQGVVLVLVGPQPDGSSSESLRTLRMYNLASLASLAKWAVANKGSRPLDLHRPSNWQAQQTPTKKHRAHGSITRGFKSFMETPTPNQTPEPNTASYHTLLSPSASSKGNFSGRASPSPTHPGQVRQDSDDSTWDVIDDLPLRWATDFVSLATPGSRLANTSIISYAIWSDEIRKGRGGQLLAIASKSNIFLYETPKGERAFRFVKEFYAPLHPRSITFFHQSLQEIPKATSEVSPGRFRSHRRSDSAGTVREAEGATNNLLNYGNQLSLFVVFDKKAGWIRLADSAVGEVELYEDKGADCCSPIQSRETLTAAISNGSLRSKARISFDIQNLGSKWVAPTKCDIPIPGKPEVVRSVHLLTRGKRTHIIPAPLHVNSALHPPLKVLQWQSHPRQIATRICEWPETDEDTVRPPFLQIIAFGENGIEIQESSLEFLSKGKGKAVLEDPVWAEEDLGGEAGFLMTGGHWDQTQRLISGALSRAYSTASTMSSRSFSSMETDVMLDKLKKEEGIYGWCRKGMEDYRVFWVGGSPSHLDDTRKDK